MLKRHAPPVEPDHGTFFLSRVVAGSLRLTWRADWRKEQETEELGDDVIARLNPHTGEVESLEVLFFSARLLRQDLQVAYH